MMSKKKIYVCHETGNKNHYIGLEAYCDANEIYCCYREFALFYQIKMIVKTGKLSLLLKLFVNVGFLISLLISKNKIVVLGAAPYDWSMLIFYPMSSKHMFFYHSSWVNWDGSCVPKSADHFLSKRVKASWRSFLECGVKGVFCVSKRTQSEILKAYHVNSPTSVVNHSLDRNIFGRESRVNHSGDLLKCLYVGRIVEKKGIAEILSLASRLPHIEFGFVGNGDKLEYLKINSKGLSNIKIYGHQVKSKVADIMRKYDILLLPSKKGYGAWQELFGIALIEAMSMGLIPLASNHFGPNEIITDGFDGYLIDEKKLESEMYEKILFLQNAEPTLITDIKQNAVLASLQYDKSAIAIKWGLILQKYLKGSDV
ncbi:glycosyltransferase family 4 protein [Sphingobacterium griseoflavum]|uniref:Glycosyl transferase family 1 domain-containing protein n=1 Tax=Sphingobacterium griseoflavum TaxID=1474952 RepID=A0ABQ3HVX5_9SPHI|nr:glycosyltransferase [Sphingobacterium griseoflavum]GHE39058.1 hypothetical protein GCM10017764_22820 [Sphingobacterium griseoflavum]